jgi:hypothetical protein
MFDFFEGYHRQWAWYLGSTAHQELDLGDLRSGLDRRLALVGWSGSVGDPHRFAATR